MQLKAAIEEFIMAKTAEGKAPRTIKDYKRVLFPFLTWCKAQGIIGINELQRTHVREWVASLRAKGWADGTVAIFIRNLRAFLNWSFKEGILTTPLAQAIKAPKKTPPKVTIPEKEDIEALLKTCDESFLGLRDRAIILIFLDTGIRVGELCSLNLNSVVFEADGARLFVWDPKSKQAKWGFLQKDAAEALARYLEERGAREGKLFLNHRGRPLTAYGIRQMLRRRARQAGVPPERVHPHAFRKAFATWWLRSGGDEFTLMQLGGWKTKEVLKHYVAMARMHELEELHRLHSPVQQLNLTRKE